MKKALSLTLIALAPFVSGAPLSPADQSYVQAFGAMQRTEEPKKIVYMHPATYKAEVDIHFSPYAGGEDVLSAQRIVEWAEKYFVNLSQMIGNKAIYARIWRLSEMVTVWLPINYLATVVQHEIFGHGYRIRDISHGLVKVGGYSFGTPPPYGPGGGATSYYISDNLTTTQENTIASAGVESTAILANLIKFKWLESGFIDPRQTALYLLSQQDLTLYIGSLKAVGDEDLSGHDIHDYIKTLNWTYTNRRLTRSRLLSLSWINLFDAFTFYAAYAWFHYVFSGKETIIPMIPVWGGKYLPGLRLGLSPFGPEIFVDNYLTIGRTPFYFYVKGGRHSENDYYGLGLYAPRIFHIQKWYFGARFDAWRQPKLLMQPGNILIEQINFDERANPDDPIYPYSQQHEKKVGCAGSLIVFFRGSPRYGFETELGYKTIGYLPGYALRSSPVARLAVTLVF